MIKSALYIEARAKDEEVVERSLKRLIGKMKGDENLEVESSSFEETMEDEGMFSSIAEVQVRFSSFRGYIMTVIQYGPSAIEILEPKELHITSKEFLDVVAEVLLLAKKIYEKYDVGYKFPEGKSDDDIGLTEDEIESLLDGGALRTKIVIESREEDCNKVKKDFLMALGALEEEIFINKTKSKKLNGKGGAGCLVGIEALMYGPKTLVEIAIKHTPVLIEIIEPNEIKLSMFDLQDIGVEVCGTFFEIAHKVI